jgi:acyl-CoA reductase-like NAD-dependent aldehyde dehydrogenase
MGLPQYSKTGLDVVPLRIDGAAATSSQEKIFPIYSAKQQKIVFMVQSADAKDATTAADVALKAFATWRETSAYLGRDLLLMAADIFEARKSEEIAFQIEETSCETSWAGFKSLMA